MNDVLEILGIENFPGNSVQIYNRWGRLLYEKKQYQNEWDGFPMTAGFMGGGKVPVGTYYILLDLGNGTSLYKSYIHVQY